MGTITLAQLRCDGVDLYKMWLYDEIKGSCDLSTSYHEDFTWIGCKSTWTWLVSVLSHDLMYAVGSGSGAPTYVL